jgi:hypothetical protein
MPGVTTFVPPKVAKLKLHLFTKWGVELYKQKDPIYI